MPGPPCAADPRASSSEQTIDRPCSAAETPSRGGAGGRGHGAGVLVSAYTAAVVGVKTKREEPCRLLKMAEVVSSAVVHETVNRIISGLIDKYEQKSGAEVQMERLEMAHIKLEAALETSNKWQITSGPLLCWQKKLKRAAEECDDTQRKCRQRIQEEEEAEQQARNSSFPRRIFHTTKSLISSIFHGNIDEPIRSAVRRFEWFADGANDFLRSVEFGGTPRRYLFFDPLIGHLLAEDLLPAVESAVIEVINGCQGNHEHAKHTEDHSRSQESKDVATT
ncbi:hypothetical protein E2562_021821 [Oryza meyeriana var. granulata]|uniref:Rx N-terminal domain-containing protein n=1 Tax=Oryza meyeriana var. granulata TaxID=110450 RepID=A0A6G1ENB1_9ORYZ|nr:hypothetical protein E2562_021821 [Oryza meyeriana var. granulata]